MKNNYLKLPFSYDIDLLKKDAIIALQASWIPHFNTNDYSGTWKAVALRSLGGDANNLIPLGETETENYQNTPLLEKCTYFKSILDQFQYKLEAVRLLKLDPGSIIKEHTDKDLGYEFNDLRIHIPIQTNSKAIFYSCGEPFHMKVGECWYLNASQPHSVDNLGTTPRIHLIIDGIRNEWTDNIFEQAGYDFDFEQKNRQKIREPQIQKMIEALIQMNTPTGLALAQKWKDKLAKKEYY